MSKDVDQPSEPRRPFELAYCYVCDQLVPIYTPHVYRPSVLPPSIVKWGILLQGARVEPGRKLLDVVREAMR